MLEQVHQAVSETLRCGDAQRTRQLPLVLQRPEACNGVSLSCQFINKQLDAGVHHVPNL